ncbi:CDP-diacylglycerol--glycerol-3-phosphate 3-phosphatidyltransferase [Methylophaga frappieri]|uniref:CDP-diacylglycerol--glycerol-3-phosphate 3-phosphatidyltransferase n=1 Tax=Methylophaga frappieri (strain ATCC BAA-2434 / DSM 25690 / JAM7) TaxID=754477 RepID=I1YLG5_METFJ|nr:CDP-alcohol phosphatidyltransferase family protein [Methylophaga frappieri]AFJ03758.1 CDP-diacylglycerol--glycerol-3-phosphate 3-phosphatidyltransferase [Methylophaga frappieri]
MTLRDIPNLISIARIFLVLPVMWAMLQFDFGLALILFAVAGVSDGLDGFLAKHFQWQSRLGSILDPIADKLLLVVSFATLSYLGLLPWWLFAVVIGRDVIIVIGALAYHYAFGEYELKPLWSSKINTLMQILLVLTVMIQTQWFPEHHAVTTVGIWLVVASVINSGSEYILVWGMNAWRQRKHR